MRRSFALLGTVLSLSIACSQNTIIRKAGPTAEEPDPTEQPPEEQPPATTEPLFVDLGSVQAGEDVPFEVPEGALGFNIVVEGRIQDFDPSRPFGIERITDPTGKVVHDDFTPVGGTSPTSIAAFDTIAAASVPQSEAAASIPAGTWNVRFGVYRDPSSRIQLKGKVRIQSSGDGVFHGGKLSLHLHVPAGLRIDGTNIDAAEASTTPGITQRVDLFFQVLDQLLGIERGDVVYHTEEFQLAEVNDEELLQGFAVSSGSKEGSQELHVLLTNRITQNGEPVAQGISPGIPGAANLFGRSVSGIIVATTRSDEADVLTMVHEMGHFIGLNHTSEFAGDAFDPLDDTPRCTNIGSGALQSCPDRYNIMFPAGAIAGPVTLSETQKRVYRGSPIYTAFTASSQQTQSYRAPRAPFHAHPIFRASGAPLAPIERELAMGFCGLTPIDAEGMLQRYGEAALRAAANDEDLAEFMRGRARLALDKLGLPR